ncbi:MAG: ATP-dependent DNA helicase RecG [Anaerovoracaceae bacterium]|nr:ATP-dependent DNA helicase RecG [Anaerovoracaceae bacterium]
MNDKPVDSLKGIGKRKSEDLAKAGIYTFQDLIYYLPKSYEDRRSPTPIASIFGEGCYFVAGKVKNKKFKYMGRKSLLSFDVEDDGGGVLRVVFFNGIYVNNMIHQGDEYSFFGNVSYNGGRIQMVHPEFALVGSREDERGILPVYGDIGRVKGRQIRTLIRQIDSINPLGETEEWLCERVIDKANVCTTSYALRGIHFPREKKEILEGKYRLIFDELLTLETGLLLIRGKFGNRKNGVSISSKHMDEYVKLLPFSLTEDQKKVLREIAGDMESSSAMNRLIQGDVGSGKTAIAEVAMYMTAKEGYQSVFMAPTEILARQHYESIGSSFQNLGIRCGLLVSKQSKKLREGILNRLADGEIDVIIGTHALLGDGVKFNKLGLVITDEQHRFGVNQRQILTEKGLNPNVMVMTATPIPRTMAVVVYGDLDISVIKSMPRGRKKIITKIAKNKFERESTYLKVNEELKAGRQGYVISPLIEESDAIDANSALELYEEMSERFSDFNVALLHGRMTTDEKSKVMEAFYEGEVDLLVSTVVIEVGINVPNATVMVIENSERFGLAQLHQLRGRVGRGNFQSYCFLILNSESEISNQRAEIMEKTSDGFIIAEEDLKLRGPGDILGTRQHGLPNLRFAHLTKHVDVMQNSLMIAKDILEDDPTLNKSKNRQLKERIKRLYGDGINLVL